MSEKIVKLGYPIYEGMPVYPGLPEVKVTLKEDKKKGDPWNGSVLSIYLHAGTHVDAPFHHFNDSPLGIDGIPADHFVYDHPLVIDIDVTEKDQLITVEDLKSAGDALYEADFLIFNTGAYKKRDKDFMDFATGFATVSPEAAQFIRQNLSKVKAVGTDTLSIENIPNGSEDGFSVHKAFLDPDGKNSLILIYEDLNIAPIVGKKIQSIFCTPLSIVGKDASIVNPFARIED